MAKITLLDPLGYGKSLFRHSHFLRDWTGGWILGFHPFPPLDLICLAAYLHKYGHNVCIIEANAKHMVHKTVISVLKEQSPDFVFLPSTFLTFDDDKYLSHLIRKNLPHIKIIFAGSFVTYDPSLILSDDSVDFVALGEYELPVLNIINGDSTDNVAYRKGNKILCGKRNLLNLNDLPIPARDLINNQIYQYAIFNRRNPVTAMTISRGCPHSKCEFCHSTLYSLGQIRYRRLDTIITEINEIVYKYKIGEIFFRDQTFTANRELVVSICEYIISKKIDVLWRVSTRVDLVDKELLVLMRKAGCFQISFGFESSSQESLDINNKGINIEQSKQAAKLAKRAGIEVGGMFICGMWGDTKESIRQLSNFVLELDIDYANFKSFHIVPGSPFYEKYKKAADKTDIFTNRLAKIYTIACFLRFYFRPNYLLKQLNRISSWDDFKFLIKSGLSELFFHF